MSRVKDPQAILVGLIKNVGTVSSPREMVAVSLPPKVDVGSIPKLIERTLLINLPDEEQIEMARNHDTDSFGRPVYPTIRCYFKTREFDGRMDDRNRRNEDPQTVLLGTIQPVKNNHTLLVVEFHGESLFPSPGFLANTLLVNVPSPDDTSDEVLCYYKFKLLNDSENSVREEIINNRERLAGLHDPSFGRRHQYHGSVTV